MDTRYEAIRCECGTVIARQAEGRVIAGVMVTRTKRHRIYVNPEEIQCDRCDRVWRPGPKVA